MSTGGAGGVNVGSVYVEAALKLDKLEAGARQAEQAIERIVKEAVALDMALHNNEISAAQHKQKMDLLIATGQNWHALMGRQKAEIDQITASLDAQSLAQARVARATEQARSGLVGTSQSLLQLGRVVQDFQAAGLRGILNNIEGMTMALGGPAGLAGILTIVGVAFEVLKPQIMALWEALQQGDASVETVQDKLEGLKDKIKELTEKPHKISVDFHNLEEAERTTERIKANLAGFKALAGKQPEAVEKAGKEAGKAIVEFGGGDANTPPAENVKQAMIKAVLEDMKAKRGPSDLAPEDTRSEAAKAKQAEIDRTKREIEANARLPQNPGIQAEGDALRHLMERQKGQLDQLTGGIGATLESNVEQMIGAATRGDPAAIDKLAKAQERFPGEFAARGVSPMLAGQLRQATPENQGQEEINKADQAESDRRVKKRKAARVAAAKKAEQVRKQAAAQAKRDQEAEDRAREQDDQHNLTEFHSNRAKNRRRVQEAAKDLAPDASGRTGEFGMRALEGKLTDDDVMGQLLRRGAKPDVAVRRAPEVRKAVEADVDKRVRERAREDGIQEGEARRRLAAEALERNRAADRAPLLRDRAEGKRIIGEHLPEADEMSRRAVQAGIDAGMAPARAFAGAQERLKQLAVGAGAKPEEAEAGAAAVVGETRQKLLADALRDQEQQMRERATKQPEIIGGARALHDTIQTHVAGGDLAMAERRRTNALLLEIQRTIQEGARKPVQAILG